jgi:hypothetical protein
VIVAATVGPHVRTASTAFFEVQCSSTIRRRGKAAWILCRVGRNAASALRTVIASLPSALMKVVAGVLGASRADSIPDHAPAGGASKTG